jgi:hypothetical protein
VFESLRDRLDALLRSGGAGDARAAAHGLQGALVEAKAALAGLHQARDATGRALEAERRALSDAERRGRLAADAGDPETVRVAEDFAGRHRERVSVLERKFSVQADEVAMAEREVEELTAMWRGAKTGAGAAESSLDAAWRELEAAGMPGRVGPDAETERLRHEVDRTAREAAVEAQLAELKRRLGKS